MFCNDVDRHIFLQILTHISFFVKPKINLNLYIPKEHLVHLCTLMFPLTKETVTNYTEWSWTKCNWEMPERTLQMNAHILYKI